MELEVTVELGGDVDGADGEGLDIAVAGAAEGGRAVWRVTTAAADDLGSARGKPAARLTLSVSLTTGEATEGETPVVGEVTRVQITPAEATRLLGVALVIRVVGAVESAVVIPAL